MEFDNTEVYGFTNAISGMRNSWESWEKSDSVILHTRAKHSILLEIGENDMALMQKLILAGSEHAKFMRFIHVSADVYAPRYWWSHADTYHFIEANSTSTMHKLLSDDKMITKEDFVDFGVSLNVYEQAIEDLNELKKLYRTANNKSEIIRIAKAILPEGYIQMRTIDTNYAELRNMYLQRRNHKLPEWSIDFVDWIKMLPYGEELIMCERSDVV